MKNIHLIPTDKPSRLHEFGNIWFKHKEPTECFRNYNIYITSDEEIKQGDYVCASGGFRFVKTLNKDKAKTFKDDGIVSKQNPSSSCHLSNYKKIILTTDQDLIKDGVQAIDDEFLEWFVNNPSCEEVEIETEHICARCYCNDPDDCWSAKECSDGKFDKIKYKLIIKKEPKQETIEEVVEKLTRLSRQDAFYEGAKWQEERRYSEEEVNEIMAEVWNSCEDNKTNETFSQVRKRILEQFKKKL